LVKVFHDAKTQQPFLTVPRPFLLKKLVLLGSIYLQGGTSLEAVAAAKFYLGE